MSCMISFFFFFSLFMTVYDRSDLRKFKGDCLFAILNFVNYFSSGFLPNFKFKEYNKKEFLTVIIKLTLFNK